MPVPCVTEALKEAKEREEEELRKRREAEDAEIARRLREGHGKELADTASLEQPKTQTDEPSAQRAGASEKTQGLPETGEQALSVEQLKKTYRKLRKRAKAEDVEEMKRIKKQIAELTGLTKKVDKHLKKVRVLRLFISRGLFRRRKAIYEMVS